MKQYIPPRDYELMLMMAFRYALGRRTYVVSYIVDEILTNWENLDKSRQEQIKREIIEHEEMFNSLGDDCDKSEWYKIINK